MVGCARCVRSCRVGGVVSVFEAAAVPPGEDRQRTARSCAGLYGVRASTHLAEPHSQVVVCGIRTCDGVRYAHKGSEDLHVLPSNGPAPLHQHGSTVKVRLSMSSSDAVHWLLVQVRWACLRRDHSRHR